jgi:hypothetical protein
MSAFDASTFTNGIPSARFASNPTRAPSAQLTRRTAQLPAEDSDKIPIVPISALTGYFSNCQSSMGQQGLGSSEPGARQQALRRFDTGAHASVTQPIGTRTQQTGQCRYAIDLVSAIGSKLHGPPSEGQRRIHRDRWTGFTTFG